MNAALPVEHRALTHGGNALAPSISPSQYKTNRMVSNPSAPAPSATEAGSGTAFLLQERISLQWRTFLRALFDEMLDQLSQDESRELMRDVGTRMAGLWPLGSPQNLKELESALNQCLLSARWGCATLNDSGSSLVIVHRFSPLRTVLADSPHVPAAVLEGLYEGWLHSVGAGAELKARVDHTQSDADSCVIAFGAAPN